MSSRFSAAVTLAILLVDPSVAAGGERVTLQDAYRSAMAKNERVKIGEEGVFQSRMSKGQALSFLFPKVTVEGSYTRYPKSLFAGPGNAFLLRSREAEQFSVKGEQILFSGGQTLAGLRVAGEGVRGSAQDLRQSREDLLLDVARAYYAVLTGQKIVESDNRDAERLEAHLKTAQARLRVGEVTRTVPLRAEAELAGARVRQIQGENELSIARSRLAVLAGLSENFETADPVRPEAPETAIEEMQQGALLSRADVRRAEINQRIARENVTIAQSGFFPKLYLEGTYVRVEQDPSTVFLINHEYYGGFRATISLFEGGKTLAETREARSRVRSAEYERRLLEKNVAIEVKEAYDNLKAVEATVDQFSKQVAFSQENFTLVSKQFANGLATHIDVLDADITLSRAEKDLATSVYDRDLAVLVLQERLGVLLERNLPEFAKDRK